MSNIITFEQSKLLKELGYNEPTREYYESSGYLITQNESRFILKLKCNSELPTEYSAPTVSSALDWIREKKHTPCYVDAGYCHQYNTVGYWGVILSDFGYIKRVQTETSPTHSLAESALLTAVLEYLIEKEK